MAAAAIPAIIGAAGSIGGAGISAYSAGKQSKAYRDWAQPSPADIANRGRAEKYGGQLGNIGELLYGQGQGNLGVATDYYKKLMSDRYTAQGAVAPAAENIADVYGGARRGVESGTARGGVRDYALAELDREKTGRIARLYSGVQPMAAAALESTGRFQTGTGVGATGGAARTFTDLLGQGRADRALGLRGETMADLSGTRSGENIGALLFSILASGAGKDGKGATGTGANIPLTTNPPQGYRPPPRPPLVMST